MIQNFRYERIYAWFLKLTKRLSDRQQMMALAVIVGTIAGLATVFFELVVHAISESISRMSWSPWGESNILYFICPILGVILVSLFVRRVVKDNISEGVTRVLYAISKKNSHLKIHNTWSSLAASSLTLGFGGSVGPEAPIVLTGAAIGSNVGQMARLNYRNTTLLLCCGAGAAVSAIFKAPITGVLFVLEILMLDITVGTVFPLLIATITATTWALFMRGFDPIFAVTLSQGQMYQFTQIPLYVILGIITGLMGCYLTMVNEWVGAKFKKLDAQWKKWAAGGVIIGLLIFLFPPLYGEGYSSIMALMNGEPAKLFNNSLFFHFQQLDWAVLIFLVATMFFKVIAMSSTLAAGGVGGTFAPSLFIGAFAGASLAVACRLFLNIDVSVAAFTLIGMAGVMSGVMNAPLTSIFLIAELSSGYGLFIPLMIVASVAFAVNKKFEPESIYTKPLSRKGELLTHNKDRSTLVFLNTKELMDTDFVPVKMEDTLGDLVKLMASAKHNIFPVVNDGGRLVGMVQLDDLREDMFNSANYANSVQHYMIKPPDVILDNELMESVLNKFDSKRAWVLPIVTKEGQYLGFISKSRILTVYREQLIQISH
ncbi:MAG: chloride channel protein [Rikenellaceae bacterium]